MRKRYQQLIQKRQELVARGKATIDAAEVAGRGLTAEEITADEGIQAELVAIGSELQVFERQHARETSLVLPSSARINVGAPLIEGDPMRGFRSAGDFARAVRAACAPGGIMDPRLAAMRAGGFEATATPSNFQQEAGTSGEGYMVPPQIALDIWTLIFEGNGSILDLVNPEPTESNAVEMMRDESTPWGASGVQAAWRSEGVVMNASKLTTGLNQVRLFELFAFVLATEELLEDAPRLTSRLTTKAADAIRFKAADAIINGTGAGQPLGVLQSGALVTQTKEAAQPTLTLVAANVAKIYSRMLATSLSSAIWLINSDVLPQLLTMTLGQNTIYVPPSVGFINAPGGFLLGRPVLPVEHCASLTSKGDIIFFDPKGYYATTKARGLEFAQSMHLFFDYAISAFRWTFRIGGQPYLSAPVSPFKGSTTKSHFITLEAR